MIGRKGLYRAIVVALCILGSGAFYWYVSSTPKTPVSFFTNRLDNAHITEAVVVEGKTYTVVNGSIQGNEDLSLAQKTKVLETAYALALFTLAPVLNLSGTHTEALQQSVSALEKTLTLLSNAQKNPSDAKHILHLYPVAYLGALAKLEAARQTFITSGKDTDEASYLSVLDAAVDAGTSDLAAFSQSFNEAVGTSSQKRFASLGGTVTTLQLQKALLDIQAGLQKTAQKARDQKLCITGGVSYCDARALETPDVPALRGNTGNVPPETLAQITAIRSVFADARHDTLVNTQRIIALSSSVCGALLDGPYIHLSQDTSGPNPSFSPQFLNDIFFEETKDKTGKTITYLRDSLAISYLYYNPNTFYICPDSGKDISQIVAVNGVVSFANQHVSTASGARALLYNPANLVYERDAARYVNEALRETPKDLRSPEYRSLLSLRQMFTYHSAGLERLVAQIQAIDAHDFALLQRGTPFDLSAKTLFLTHSAFPSLFQLYNSSFGAQGLPIKEISAADTTQTLSALTSYTELIPATPRAKIVHDLETYYNFEK